MAPVLSHEFVGPEIEGGAGVGAPIDVGVIAALDIDHEAVDRLAPAHEAKLERPAGGERSRLTAPD